jgi:hypothetical protein
VEKATTPVDIAAPVKSSITPEHQAYLASQAVDPALASLLGVRSLTGPEEVTELGEGWERWNLFPALVFPWTSPDGRVEYQLRPDNPSIDKTGRPRKYMFRKGMAPVLWAVRPLPDASRMLIVEGTKQALSAGSYAPEGTAVYGISGCRSWQQNGVPIGDLVVADGRDVVVILDADAASNLDVYTAGTGLAQALAMEGAERVVFARLPGGGKTGLDDILSSRAPDRRAGYLSRLIDGAKPKPADAKPKPKRKGSDTPEVADRVTLVCNRDRLEVIEGLTKALIDRWDSRELFNHGGVISWRGAEGMKPVDRGAQRDIIQRTAITVDEIEDQQGTRYNYTWPDANTIASVMSRADSFSPLDRIAHAPYVRPDGTIVTEGGYDDATRTVLILEPEMEGMNVPDMPTQGEVEAARELLMTEWLGDFPLASDADRANALALVVTPAIRGLVPRVPLAVVDGRQMGVGKNLLADVILTVYLGSPAEPMNFTDEPDELRKQITSAFRSGAEFFVFDEAHVIQGTALAQALTATTWRDRILGVSTMANFPNRVTWISLGNQVQVKGDLTRRVYRIALHPDYANPQDRDTTSFRHPGQSGLDLGSWTRKNRRDLLTAILTLVRAWFAQGCPYPKRGVSFGSFETWERFTGGILEVAGMPGFLGNLKVWRSESDFDSQYWVNHLRWLVEKFGTKQFRTGEVKTRAAADPAGYLAPPKLDDPTEKDYSKKLGETYSRYRGRRYEGMYMDRAGGAHGNVSVWHVVVEGEEGEPAAAPESPAPDPVPEAPTPVSERAGIIHGQAPGMLGEMERALAGQSLDSNGDPQPTALPAPLPRSIDVVALDLETGDKSDLYRTGPGYVRLTGAMGSMGNMVIRDGAEAAPYAATAVQISDTVTGHNIMAFDLPALVREGVLTMTEVHAMAQQGRIFDALLVARHLDPPMAREKGVDHERRYDLGNLAERLGLAEKLSDVSKSLAKKHKGWANIPTGTDTPDGLLYRQYLTRDVELSRDIYHHLMSDLGGTVPEYVVREHRVAALASQISINGFLVDQERLATEIEKIDKRKADAMALLSGKYGIPTLDAKGKPYKSPLSSKVGKQALTKALVDHGATMIWRTEKSKEIMVGADHMRHLADEYGHNPAVVEIANAVYKIVSSRTVYETIHNSMCPDGRVHPAVSFKQATGRWSLTNPGLTVMGKRGGRYVERMVLLPDPGEVILTVDLSQVDMRALAGLSQDQAYIDMLRHDDPHAEIAKALFGDVKRRDDAKAIGHGWNYGRSLQAISESEDIAPDLVVAFDRSMRERFPRLVEWQGEVREIAASGALLDNGFGRMMRPDPQRSWTQGPALMGQGAARDIMMTGKLRLADSAPETLPMLRAQVHDEIVLSVPVDIVEDVKRAVVDAFTFEWKGVPILADAGPLGETWGHCYIKG